ncbi:glycerophosphodiester phosphodiesterase family protein [Herbiconiux sp. L3-i23]|uniref:glycerophosphodiester phosphodiesterase family protein n=1 Tax=Herbiconiux sp. L3-i23 TaxID=2905871 RepID=UPI002054AD07|nr:glycerophosphodiester phosphodiesterase family protein [Herbiconiux sp. L3-i23]BDI22646.1 glycerophosphoryl diester phosphodiesterase [Herbiconiux sp. L3-i23]
MTTVRGADYFAPPRPRVIAHRGLATNAPENTLGAFAAALDAGATHLETDVHATRDGHAVIMHDADLARVLGDDGVNAVVARLTLDELRDAATGRLEICTLSEALQTFPSALVNIDVKAAAAAAPAAAAIRQAGAEGRVLVTSFSRRRRRAAIRRLDSVATSASAIETALAILFARIGAVALAARVLRRVDALQIPASVLGIATTTPAMLERLHRAVREVHIWTVNDPAEMRRMLDAGVDGIVTDRCDLLVGVLRRDR